MTEKDIDMAIAELDGLKGFLDDDCSTQRALDIAIEVLEEKEKQMETEFDALEKQPEWIPVTEDLPEINMDVLITYITPTNLECGIVGKGKLDELGFWWIQGKVNRATVTAWQPLPEPYREVEE